MEKKDHPPHIKIKKIPGGVGRKTNYKRFKSKTKIEKLIKTAQHQLPSVYLARIK